MSRPVHRVVVYEDGTTKITPAAGSDPKEVEDFAEQIRANRARVAAEYAAAETAKPPVVSCDRLVTAPARAPAASDKSSQDLMARIMAKYGAEVSRRAVPFVRDEVLHANIDAILAQAESDAARAQSTPESISVNIGNSGSYTIDTTDGARSAVFQASEY